MSYYMTLVNQILYPKKIPMDLHLKGTAWNSDLELAKKVGPDSVSNVFYYNRISTLNFGTRLKTVQVNPLKILNNEGL